MADVELREEEGRKSGKQWKRVMGGDLCPRYSEVAKKNVDTMNSQAFKDACAKVGLPTTRRQASKFRRKMGKAYKQGRM